MNIQNWVALLLLSLIASRACLFSENQINQHGSQHSPGIIALESRPAPVHAIQCTFAMVKPLAVREGHTGDILARLEAHGFRVIALRMRMLSSDEVKRFYAEHASKPFFPELVQKMSASPVVTMVLERDDAVATLRHVVGATDPKKALPTTIRYEFGVSASDNAIHASDGPASAEREIEFFFADDEMYHAVKSVPK